MLSQLKKDRLTKIYEKISLQGYPYLDIALIKLLYILNKPSNYFIVVLYFKNDNNFEITSV